MFYFKAELTSFYDHFKVKTVLFAAYFYPLQLGWLSDGTVFDFWPPFIFLRLITLSSNSTELL